SRFGAWVVGIARQVVRERRRSLRRDRHEFVGQLDDPGLVFNGIDTIDDADELKFIFRKLRSLDERERLAIHAFFLDQRGAQHAAEQLGLSRSGLYALVARAVTRLTELVRTQHLDIERKP